MGIAFTLKSFTGILFPKVKNSLISIQAEYSRKLSQFSAALKKYSFGVFWYSYSLFLCSSSPQYHQGRADRAPPWN